MLKLVGDIEITKIDSLTGEVTDTIRQTNLIPNNTLLSILSWDAPTNFFGGARVSISSQETAPALDVFMVDEILATGYVPEGITSPVWIDTIEPPYGIIKNRINFIGIARTFNTVALTKLLSTDNQFTSAIALAYLLLDLPCTQGAFEFLSIQYRIQFLEGDGQKFINERTARYNFGEATFGIVSSNGHGFRMSWLYASLFQFNSVYASVVPSGLLIAALFPGVGSDDFTWTSGTRIDAHYKWKYQLAKTRVQDVGTIYNLMSQGISNDSTEVYNIRKFDYLEEPFQTGFWHGNGSNKPFSDESFLGTSQGKISLSGTWSGGFPELYKIEITADGNSTSAQYKFSLMKHLGFNDNSYTVPDTPCPYLQKARQPAPGIYGWKEENFDKHRYSNTQIVQYDSVGVTLIDVVTGAFTSWSSTTTPAITPTAIRQVEIDTEKKKIYVACRATGLWIIDVAPNTVTHPIAAPCYGVDVGHSGVAYAIASTGFFTSADWSTPATFTYIGISDGNWSRVHFLKADPSSDNLAIVADDGAGLNKVVWYTVSTDTASQGYNDTFYTVPSYPACLDVSDVNSQWWLYSGTIRGARNLIFGNTNYSSEVQSYYKLFTHPIYGEQYYSKISFYEDSVFTLSSLAGSITYDYPNFDNQTIYVLHLDSGIILTNRFLRQIFSASSSLWTDYGWNGSAWIKDNLGSKTASTTPATLINGLFVAFTDSTDSPQFVVTEFLTQGVNYGLLKDNATLINTYVSAWYSRAVIFDTAYTASIPGSAPFMLTLSAASNPDFLRLETDSPKLHQFKINGVAVVAVYVSGEPPGPNEVAIASSGVVTFNSVDAGKTFNAIYTYIKI